MKSGFFKWNLVIVAFVLMAILGKAEPSAAPIQQTSEENIWAAISELEISLSIVPPEAPKGISKKVESAIAKLKKALKFLAQGKNKAALGKVNGAVKQTKGTSNQINKLRCNR